MNPMKQKTTNNTVFEASEQAKITEDLESCIWVDEATATEEVVVVNLDCLNTDNIRHIVDKYNLVIDSVTGVDLDGGIRSEVNGLSVVLTQEGVKE